jgi:very-short-patch-repair endonuclease
MRIIEGWEVDFWWPRQRFAIGFDGWDGHRSRAAFERDRVKQSQLVAAGIQLACVTGRRPRDEPYAVVAETAAVLNAG